MNPVERVIGKADAAQRRFTPAAFSYGVVKKHGDARASALQRDRPDRGPGRPDLGATGLAQAGLFTMAQVWNLPGPARPGYVQRLGRALERDSAAG